ncbi:hypothetical protein [Pseudomonas tussilaginis]|uniref:hypothetical protein n=1 Tax=Pseudomonas sp. 5 TaxID=1619949 RepID=UPI0012E05181|nr:hypothetical protein [Pseudomonas sp. 5]
MELVKRLGGVLSMLAPPNVKIMVGMVLPNTTSPDSAFYTTEQYAELTEANSVSTRMVAAVRRVENRGMWKTRQTRGSPAHSCHDDSFHNASLGFPHPIAEPTATHGA